VKKMGNELNRAFSKDEVQMVKKFMKRVSTSLDIKEIQVKTTLRFHLTPVRKLQSRTQTITNVHENVGKKGPSYTAGGNVKYNQYGKQYGDSSKN
jgi:hypothetical protein